MKLYSWNINGIRAVIKKQAFLPFIAEHQPDILCLQETKASSNQVEIDLPEYHEVWNSAKKPGYSGTALFSKTRPLAVWYDFPPHIVEEFAMQDDPYGNPNAEGRIIAAEFDTFIVATVYTPNSKGDLSRLRLRHEAWDKAWLAYMKELEAKKPVLFCGDLNVAHTEDDLARPKPNIGKHGFTNEEREGFQAFVDAGFVDAFRLFNQGNGYYTWWTHWANARARNVGWRIDYWLVSHSLVDKVTAANIHPDIIGSDHCPVSITMDLP